MLAGLILCSMWFVSCSSEHTPIFPQSVENLLISDLRFLEAVEGKLQTLRSSYKKAMAKITKMREIGKNITDDLESYVYNPIKRIELFERYVEDWPDIEEFLKTAVQMQTVYSLTLSGLGSILPGEDQEMNDLNWITKLQSFFDNSVQPFCRNPSMGLWTLLRKSGKEESPNQLETSTVEQ